MNLANRFVLAFWVYVALLTNICASESKVPSPEESAFSCRQIINIMEELEEAKSTPKVEIPITEKITCQENHFINFPPEIISKILDMVLLYKDQLSFLICASWCKEHAKNISRTHIYKLKKDSDRTFSLNLLENLKYLWISNCDIPGIKFNVKKLTGLAVRWSNIDLDLLLNQCTLSYLDVRTINRPLLSESSLSYLGISIESPNRMVFSCENETLLKTLNNNKNLMVLKLNITKNQEHSESRNIYENLLNLGSLELIDLVSNQPHANFLTRLGSLNEIIFSSFETGLMESNYKEALRIIVSMPQQKHLTIKCLNDKQLWEVVYDGINVRLNPNHYL